MPSLPAPHQPSTHISIPRPPSTDIWTKFTSQIQNTIYFSPFYLFSGVCVCVCVLAISHRCRVVRVLSSSTPKARIHSHGPIALSVFIVSSASPKIITNFLVTNCLLSSYKISLVHYLFAIRSRSGDGPLAAASCSIGINIRLLDGDGESSTAKRQNALHDKWLSPSKTVSAILPTWRRRRLAYWRTQCHALNV